MAVNSFRESISWGVIVAEIGLVARNQSYGLAGFEGERPVAIELHLIEPIASGKVPDRESLHWLNEREVACHPWSPSGDGKESFAKALYSAQPVETNT